MADWLRLIEAKQIKDPVERILAIRSARSKTTQRPPQSGKPSASASASSSALPSKKQPASLAAPKFTARRPRPLNLGVRSGGGDPYSLDLSDQANAICAIAGMSGSGKTHFLRSLATAFWTDEIPTILFDLHGDLKVSGVPSVTIGAESGFDPVALLRELSPDTRRAIFRQLLPKIGYVQEGQLSDQLEKSKTLPELLRGLAAPTASAAGLQAAIERTFSDRAFYGRGFDTTTLGQRSLRLDFSGLSRSAQPVAAALVLLLIFERLRQAGPTMKAAQLRTFVCLDEASVLAGADTVDILCRESRKFGLGLAVASQSVRDLSADILGNAAVAVCFRLNTRAEAALVEKLIPGMTAAQLVSLRAPGEALIRDRHGVARVELARLPTPKKKSAA